MDKSDLLRFAHQHGFHFGFTEQDATLGELVHLLRIHAKTKVSLQGCKAIENQIKVEKLLEYYGY
jgi:hypothetical protein